MTKRPDAPDPAPPPAQAGARLSANPGPELRDRRPPDPSPAPPPDHPGALPELAADMAEVEAQLAAATADADPLVADAAGHLLRAGGKRLRPALVLTAAGLGAGVNPAVLSAAVVVELTHVASLYHDDVIDAAPRRRGAPSAHARFGNTVAILTGDLLFARASNIMADLGHEAIAIHARAFDRLCQGQIRETAGPASGDDPIAHHLSVLSDKTASLIAASAHLGALLAGAPPAAVTAAVAYGEKVGLAFQLADDLIDLTADPAVSGKTPGTDLREHVPTMPVLLLQAQAAQDRQAGGPPSDTIRLAAALEGDLTDDATLAAAAADLAAHPATAEARAIAARWAEAAIADLALLPDTPAKQALTDFAHLTTARLA